MLDKKSRQKKKKTGTKSIGRNQIIQYIQRFDVQNYQRHLKYTKQRVFRNDQLKFFWR